MGNERKIAPVNGVSGEPRDSREHNERGIKYFTGAPLPDRDSMITQALSITADELRLSSDRTKNVWRPEETVEVANPLFTLGRVNVIGAPQAGKGTILFGLSEICNRLGWGYTFIDGHLQEATADEVVATIHESEKRNFPIFFDSTDYLFVTGRQKNVTSAFRDAKAPIVIDALVNATVPVATTSHTEEWADHNVDKELRAQFAAQLATFPRYELPIALSSDASIMRFLLDNHMPEDHAQFLIDMSNGLYPSVTNVLTNAFGDKNKVAHVYQAARNYPVLKDLTRGTEREGRVDEFTEVMDKIVDSLLDTHPFVIHEGAVKDLAQLIIESDHRRIHLATIRKLHRWNKAVGPSPLR